MSFEYPQSLKISRVAKVDLRTKQFFFVKVAALAAAASDGLEDEVDLLSGATDIPIGVLQNKPNIGEEAEICVIGVTKVSGSADLSSGFPATPQLIRGDANGQVAAAASSDYVVGQLLIAPTALAAIGTAIVNCANPWLKA